MVFHLTYREERYTDARTCIEEVRKKLNGGWVLTQIRGPAGGPFIAVYRIEQDEA